MMLHYLPYVIGATATLTSRLLTGEDKFPKAMDSLLKPLADRTGELSEFLAGIKAESLSIWAKLGEQALRQAMSHGVYLDLYEWFEAMDYKKLDDPEPVLLTALLDRVTLESVDLPFMCESDEGLVIWKWTFDELSSYLLLPEGGTVEVFKERVNEGKSVSFALWVDKHSEEKIWSLMEDSFWKKHARLPELDVDRGDLFVFCANSEVEDYYGPYSTLPNDWLSIMAKKDAPKSLTVLVTGKPGSGKSRFGLYAGDHYARGREKDHCLVVNQKVVEHMDLFRWQRLMKQLDPEVCIIEDFKPSKLSQGYKRVLMDQQHRYPSLTIFTMSQDEEGLDRLTSQFDMHLDLDQLTREDRYELSKSLVGAFGLLDDESTASIIFDEVAQQLEHGSVAAAVAKLRQAKYQYLMTKEDE